MDYINTSHPNFIGGSKAVETAQQQIKSSRAAAPILRPKVCLYCSLSHSYSALGYCNLLLFPFLSFSIILVITFDFNFWFAFVNQDTIESEKGPSSERSLRSRAILARQPNGVVPEQVGLTSFLH